MDDGMNLECVHMEHCCKLVREMFVTDAAAATAAAADDDDDGDILSDDDFIDTPFGNDLKQFILDSQKVILLSCFNSLCK